MVEFVPFRRLPPEEQEEWRQWLIAKIAKIYGLPPDWFDEPFHLEVRRMTDSGREGRIPEPEVMALADGKWFARGKAAERRRLQPLVDASRDLAAFMRAPDTDAEGKPADWSPGLDAVGAFYAAVDALEEET